MNPHAKWLRQAAKEIVIGGHAGWGNTCTDAADEIDRLTTDNDEMSQKLLDIATDEKGQR
ncbi:MAG: hypothetical protein ACR2PS_05595 [Pseudomonadales bacterium]